MILSHIKLKYFQSSEKQTWISKESIRENVLIASQFIPFTAVLITHDLRESVFLGDQVIVLSGRPAKTQYVMDIDLPADRTLETLYTPKVGGMLQILRDQIRIAQGRDEEVH